MQLLPTSLVGRLVLITVLLVAGVAALIGTATTLAMRDQLNDRLDEDVRAALNTALHAGGPGGPPAVPPRETDPDRDRDRDFRPIQGQSVGTVFGIVCNSPTDRGQVVNAGSATALTASQVTQLCVLPDGRFHKVELPGLGSYRVMSRDVGGATVAAGLPTEDVDDAIQTLVWWEYGLGAGAMVLAGALATLIVRRQLRPLRDVAATAHEVSVLPLASGAISLEVRVPDQLTDERTEVGQVGAALNTLLEHVETSLGARHRSEQQVRQFVADASHELRTPLATITGYAELARQRPDDVPALRTAMEKVDAESMRMAALVEDLLLLARLDAGRPLASEPVDLTMLLLEAVDDARVVAPDHHWRLELPEESAIEVTGDELRLHQVVTNLLGNARRHTPPGTTVTVSAALGNPVVLTVHDDGPGFAPELAASAFVRFTRGDTARTREESGAGLGLSLVKAVVDAHGGTVRLDSRTGSTTFTVELPTLDG